ncbi:hypothetical protein Tco_0450165 [Tanacetum coccineum]
MTNRFTNKRQTPKKLSKRGKAIGQTSHSLGEKSEKKKVSSVKLGRNKDKGNLSEEHHDQDDHTTFVYEGFDATEAAIQCDYKKRSSDVKSGDTEELDLKEIQSTARQSAVTPRTLNFEDEAGPSSPFLSNTNKRSLKNSSKMMNFLLISLWFLKLNGSLQPIKDDSLDV